MITSITEVEWTEPKSSPFAGKHCHQWHVFHRQEGKRNGRRYHYYEWEKIPQTAQKFMIERRNSPLMKKETTFTGEGDYRTEFKWTIYRA